MGAGAGGAFGLLLEVFLHAEAFLAFMALDSARCAVGEDFKPIGVIFECGIENALQTLPAGLVLYRDHELDPLVEVARHPVGRGYKHQRAATVMEGKDAGVFEVAVDHGDHADIFGFLALTGFQAADAADVEVDFHPIFGCLIEGADDFLVLE